MSPDLLRDAVLARAAWINAILSAGVILAAVVCLLRYAKGGELEVLKVKLPVSAFPLLCIAYTAGHLYCTYLFASICYSQNTPMPDVWQALTLKGPLVFAGMLPRETIASLSAFGFLIPIDQVSARDPTLWLFYGFCFVIYFAFMWSSEVAGYAKPKAILLTLVLLAVNWTAGSLWAHAASRLHGP